MNTEQPHKRYLVFYISWDVPNGGIADIISTYDTLDEIKEYFAKKFLDEYQVYDRIEGVEIDILALMENK